MYKITIRLAFASILSASIFSTSANAMDIKFNTRYPKLEENIENLSSRIPISLSENQKICFPTIKKRKPKIKKRKTKVKKPKEWKKYFDAKLNYIPQKETAYLSEEEFKNYSKGWNNLRKPYILIKKHKENIEKHKAKIKEYEHEKKELYKKNITLIMQEQINLIDKNLNSEKKLIIDEKLKIDIVKKYIKTRLTISNNSLEIQIKEKEKISIFKRDKRIFNLEL